MKNLKLINSLLIIGMTSLFCYSCSQNEDSSSSNSIEGPKIETTYDEIGALHNEGLEYVFNYLVKNQATTRAANSTVSIYQLAETAENLFLKEKGINFADTKLLTTRAKATKSDAINLNINQKEYYDKLMAIMSNYSMNYTVTQTAIAELASEIQSNLSLKDAGPLLYGIGVAKYTCYYWHLNRNKWAIEFGSNVMTRGKSKPKSKEESSSVDWKRLGKEDVKGAVSGAAGGAAAGALAGGAGALPGAGAGAVGGAVANSVLEAINQFWD
jgi:hypothetical protein